MAGEEIRNGIEWSVAIFSSREKPETLQKSIDAARQACSDKRAVVDVLVNGNKELASQTKEYVRNIEGDDSGITIRVWFIGLADKAYAWNTHIHDIDPGADVTFYIDGYVWVMPDAFRLLADGLAEDPGRLAATGVPTQGRSADQLRSSMLAHGGIHGNLMAVRGSVMCRLRQMEFRLPIGIYRGVLLIGSMLNRNLDPGVDKWDTSRVFVHADATWRKPEESAWSLAFIMGHVKRRFRQARGFLENPAARKHIVVEQLPPAELPEYADDLIIWWARSSRRDAARMCARQWLCAVELYKAGKAYKGRDKRSPPPSPELFAQVGKLLEPTAELQ